MPRYFLNVEYAASLEHSASFNEDVEGEEFETPSAALAEAKAVARELLVESIRCDSALVPRRIHVLDALSQEIGTIQIKDMVPPTIF